MKYKAGDKVRIRADLKEGEEYNEVTVVLPMIQYVGKTTTIRQVYESCYTLDVDGGCWVWTDDMFEDVDIPQIVEPKTVDVEYRIDSCDYCRLPIEWIEFIIPHEEKESKE